MKILKYIPLISIVNIVVANPSVAKLHLLHINGLNTTKLKAENNLAKYQQVVTITKPTYMWDVIYNPTQSGDEWDWVANIKGFIDVCLQKWFGNEELPTLDEITQQKMKAQGVDYSVGSDDYNKFQNNLVTDYQKLLLDNGGKNMDTIIDEFHNKVPIQYANVLSLISGNGQVDYSKSREYIILLPHSQGNIYANNLYTYLTQTEHFDSSRITIFGFASPAKAELGQMTCNSYLLNYVTSKNDGVIALSRLFFGENDVLPSNIIIPKTEIDTSGHGLKENYLSESSSTWRLNAYINLTTTMCYRDLGSAYSITECNKISSKPIATPSILTASSSFTVGYINDGSLAQGNGVSLAYNETEIDPEIKIVTYLINDVTKQMSKYPSLVCAISTNISSMYLENSVMYFSNCNTDIENGVLKFSSDYNIYISGGTPDTSIPEKSGTFNFSCPLGE